MSPTEAAAAFAALFVIIDPVGLAPVFVALTPGMAAKARRMIALRASLISLGLLLIFVATGDALLKFLGISMAAFRIAGGILLFLTALEMLFQKRQQRRQSSAKDAELDPSDDPSVFPLAMPLIVGPGTLTTIILLSTSAETITERSLVALIAASVIALVFFTFLLAPLLERLAGKTGINVITRVLGMLLAALAVQFILDGLGQIGLGA